MSHSSHLYRLAVVLPLLAGSVVAQQCPVTKFVASNGEEDDNFGFSVASEGNRAIFGAPGHDATGQNSGAAYVYERFGFEWVQTQELAPASAGWHDSFGISVALEGDDAFVGNHQGDFPDNHSGGVHRFRRQGGVWVEQEVLVGSDTVWNDGMGFSIGLSGDVLVAGASNHESFGNKSGAAYVFERRGTDWLQTAKLVGSDVDMFHLFGTSVAIDGDVIVIGAMYDDEHAVNAGSAYVFERQGTDWVETIKLTPSDTDMNDAFGVQVAVSGTRIAVAASNKTLPGAPFAGSAYVFEKQGTGWNEVAILRSSHPKPYERMGHSLAIQDGLVLTGAPGATSWAGSIYRFEVLGGSWGQTAEFGATDAQPAASLGWAGLEIDGPLAFIGAPLRMEDHKWQGAVYAYDVARCGPGAPFCFGTRCPCDNYDPMRGCARATGSGARLHASGTASIAAADAVLRAEAMAPANPALFLQSTAIADDLPFGGGRLCVGAFALGIELVQVDALGAARTTVDLAAAGGALVGDTHYFQLAYRDPVSGACGTELNTTNGYAVTWRP